MVARKKKTIEELTQDVKWLNDQLKITVKAKEKQEKEQQLKYHAEKIKKSDKKSTVFFVGCIMLLYSAVLSAPWHIAVKLTVSGVLAFGFAMYYSEESKEHQKSVNELQK